MLNNIDIEVIDNYYIKKYILSEMGSKLQKVPYIFRSLRLCFICVSSDPKALKFVPKNLLTEEFEYIPLIAISQDPYSIRYLIKNNISYVTYKEAKVVVNLKGSSLIYLHDTEYIKSKDIIMDAINNYPDAIKYVDYDIMDKDIMMAAVKGNAMSLKYIVNYINYYNKNNKWSWKTDEIFINVIGTALKNDAHSFIYIEDMKGYRDYFLDKYKLNSEDYIDYVAINDRNRIISVIEQSNLVSSKS